MNEALPGPGTRLAVARSLWSKFFLLLLAVSAVGLSASLYLRNMMLADFEEYLEGEMLDRVYQVTAGLEGGYEQWSGWEERHVTREVIRALMMGMVARVSDSSGTVLITSADALEGLSPLMRRRVLSLVDMNSRTPSGQYTAFPLFLAGERIGTFEVQFFTRDRADVFTRRSNRFLLIAFFTMGGLAVATSLLASRALTGPIRKLQEQTGAIRRGDLTGRVDVAGGDEIGELSRSFNEMARDLELLEDLRRKVIANVAHELRTPVAVIRTELEGMIDGVIPSDERQLVSLQEEIARLTRILDGIDDLTQAQASSLDLAPRELDLAPFLEEIVERLEGSKIAEGVETRMEVTPGARVLADPDRAAQIVINLLTNAYRATPPGGTVTVGAASMGDRTVLEVSDTGRGMTAEELPRVFERFYRGSDGGLGLGLPIVRELVDAHGGEIGIESEAGVGTTVTVILPNRSET